jgi:hypothetical protein
MPNGFADFPTNPAFYSESWCAVHLVAIGHSIVMIVWHVLSKRASYEELGGDYFDRCNADTYRKKLIRKLETLGLKIRVE